MNNIIVKINYLGIPIEPQDIDEILSQAEKSPPLNYQYQVLESFFNYPPCHLPRDVLERYIEVSKKELYIPITPNEGKIFERLISPYRSAKRCYCFGEYIATIELCAHLGEMLALLLWKMTPIKYNNTSVSKEFEIKLWGCEFEKLGQDRRIKILEAFNAISLKHVPLFNELRTIRKKYFHFWSSSIDNATSDALKCFHKSSILIKEILQIDLHENDSRKLKINPLLSEYLKSITNH